MVQVNPASCTDPASSSSLPRRPFASPNFRLQCPSEEAAVEAVDPSPLEVAQEVATAVEIEVATAVEIEVASEEVEEVVEVASEVIELQLDLQNTFKRWVVLYMR